MADSQRKTANLFDLNATDTTNGYVNGAYLLSDGTESANSPYRISEYIEIQGSTAYTLVYGNSLNNPSLCFYDSSKQYISGQKYGSNRTVTVTSPSNAKYIRISYAYTVRESVMLNSGSTALPFEPYGWVRSLRKLGTSTDTLTTLPADVYADGNNATVGLVGNMEQSGTPTPQNPIQPSECGERTSNLFNIATITTGYRIQWTTGNPYEDETAVMSDYIPVTTGTYSTNVGYLIVGYDNSKAYVGVYRSEGTWEKRSSSQVSTFTVSAGSDVSYIKLLTYSEYAAINEYTRVNEGSTSLPLEPYGYKIPISSANTTTPIYLGEVQTTRQIKKLVLTGEENWTLSTAWKSTNTSVFYTTVSGANNQDNDVRYVVSDHFISASRNEVNSGDTDMIGLSSRNALTVRISDNIATTLTEFQTYLSTQYTNGTPVCVWYVLATPTTGIVNEPLRKIGDYADTVSGITIPTITGKDSFDVLTTLKPSEVSLAYTGWHDASVKEWDGSEWQ